MHITVVLLTLLFLAAVDILAMFRVIRHGYRIDVQGAQDSVSGLEYGRILNQMRGGENENGDRVRARFVSVGSLGLLRLP